jgi:RNA polymerase sigma-70 factor (sigma-E family)
VTQCVVQVVITLSSHEGPSKDTSENIGDFSRRCGVELLRVAYLLSGDRHRAEDLLQEVLLAMYRRFGDELPLDNPRAYAQRALVNANINWARRATNREIVVDRFAAPPSDVVDPVERDALWQALRQLPTRQRTVLVLRFYADASDADIAAALGCRRGTVRSLASRALATLRTDPTISEGGRA